MFIILLKLIACYAYDGYRFARAAHIFGNPNRSRSSARAHLMRLSHSLEKGMALAEPRTGFGQELTKCLVTDLDMYLTKYGPDEHSEAVVSTIDVLIAYHKNFDVQWPEIEHKVSNMRTLHDKKIEFHLRPVGTETITKQQILDAAPINPEAFFSFRRSVRQFSDLPVTTTEIERAVKMAFRAPSVCNRQGARLYVFTEPTDRERILKFQDGNAGFGERASVVFIVAVDMSIFYKNGERNQAFVDGGMFAMSLALALHSLGLGACMLNWAMSPRQDKPMRRAAGIPDNEVVVSLLAAGHIYPEFTVAASPRRPLEQVLVWARHNNALETS